MPSSFAWLDYSEEQRRRALDVISLFNVRETRDELGIGSVRDALANVLTPGTTTIQTRARYFLFVPWVYLDLERRQVPGDRWAERVRRAEEQLIPHLAGAEDSSGTIGIEAGSKVKRMPSNIYWAGLKRWGILLFEGSQHQYHRSIDRFYERVRGHRVLSREQEELGPPPRNWHPHIPEPPADFPEGASFRLSADEADYLAERVVSAAPGTLLSRLVDAPGRWEKVDFPWQLPQVDGFPEQIRWQLKQARIFSEVMYGAALLYNLMLAEELDHDEWIEKYQGRFHEWAADAEEHRQEVEGWDRREFWGLVYDVNRRIPPPTRTFVDQWTDLLLRVDPPHALGDDDSPARKVIENREAFLKRGRARLQNRRHLELWGGASGTDQLDFRWGITQQIVLDILDGRGVPGAETSGVEASGAEAPGAEAPGADAPTGGQDEPRAAA